MIDKYIERFHTKYEIVTESGCWIWTAGLQKSGYAGYHVNGKTITGHRFSYIIHKGEIPKNLCVMHSCDTPSCVNPKHLSVGTQLDNINDRNNKNRQAKGASHCKSKLTEAQVLDIRTKRLTGVEFAKMYGVSGPTICDIQKRRIWKSI